MHHNNRSLASGHGRSPYTINVVTTLWKAERRLCGEKWECLFFLFRTPRLISVYGSYLHTSSGWYVDINIKSVCKNVFNFPPASQTAFFYGTFEPSSAAQLAVKMSKAVHFEKSEIESSLWRWRIDHSLALSSLPKGAGAMISDNSPKAGTILYS